MTSVLPKEDERTIETINKRNKSGNEKMSINGNNRRDETRSFIHDFSRENLSISSHCDFEQGFNKQQPGTRWFRLSRHTMLSVIAIVVALVCASIEIFKLHRVVTNAREIEILKRDVETLRHRMFGNDFMDELNAFEQQLYADGTEDDDDDDDDGDDVDSGEADIKGADYDDNNDYEDYGSSWRDNDNDDNGGEMEDSRETTASNTESSDSPLVNNAQLKNTFSSPSDDQKRVEIIAVDKKIMPTLGQQFEKNGGRALHKNIAPERGVDDGTRQHEAKTRHTESKPKQRRAVTDEAAVKHTSSYELPPMFATTSDSHHHTNPTKYKIIDHFEKQLNNNNTTNPITGEAMPWERHPPKKYFARTRSDNSHALARHPSRRQQINSFNQQSRTLQQESDLMIKSSKRRVITRRNVRAPRQVLAAHYVADSSLFGIGDEHTGNGRAKHNEGVFKAWRASEWVGILGMTRHFTLSPDGKLTIHEPGLYLVYGQIHYLDEHDENGFHILVNNHPILQCMVYSPGMGHKSRSCFSAQITVFQAGDRLVLKDVGPARYTLFQHDKSFFGLIKLGDSRQQQQSQRQHSTPLP